MVEFFRSRTVPTQIAGHPDHSLSNAAEKSVMDRVLVWDIPGLEGPTRKPRHASVCSTHSDTQAVPALHCIRMLGGNFSTCVFKTHPHAVYQCLKKPPTFLRHASVFETHVSTRSCLFLKRAFFCPSKIPGLGSGMSGHLGPCPRNMLPKNCIFRLFFSSDLRRRQTFEKFLCALFQG